MSTYLLCSTSFCVASAALSLNNKYVAATPPIVRSIPAHPPIKVKAAWAALPKAVTAVAPITNDLIAAVCAAANALVE